MAKFNSFNCLVAGLQESVIESLELQRYPLEFFISYTQQLPLQLSSIIGPGNGILFLAEFSICYLLISSYVYIISNRFFIYFYLYHPSSTIS